MKKIAGLLLTLWLTNAVAGLNLAQDWQLQQSQADTKQYQYRQNPLVTLVISEARAAQPMRLAASSMAFGKLMVLLDRDDSVDWQILKASQDEALYVWRGDLSAEVFRVRRHGDVEEITVMALPGGLSDKEMSHFFNMLAWGGVTTNSLMRIPDAAPTAPNYANFR